MKKVMFLSHGSESFHLYGKYGIFLRSSLNFDKIF